MLITFSYHRYAELSIYLPKDWCLWNCDADAATGIIEYLPQKPGIIFEGAYDEAQSNPRSMIDAHHLEGRRAAFFRRKIV